MAERESTRIAQDLLSEPHIRRRRISVRQVYALVEEAGEDPEAVDDRYGLDIADVNHALAHYEDHPKEICEVETKREETSLEITESIERPEGADPDAA